MHMDYDPDDAFDDDYMGGVDEVYDDFDQIIDEDSDLLAGHEEEEDDDDDGSEMEPEGWAMAFALAEDMAGSGEYDLNENTDRENWEQAMRQNPTGQQTKKLRPFEQIIRDVCKGRRSVFDLDF